MRFGLAVALLLLGCDRILGLDRVDPTPPDAMLCTAGYTATGSSCYRVITTAVSATDAFTQCEQDLPGSTHLVALDAFDEYNVVQALVTATTGSARNVLIGGVQILDEPTKAAGWLSITGGALVALWQGDQPNDGDAVGDPAPEANKENLVVLAPSNNLFDIATSGRQIAVCEFDNKPIDAKFRSTFQAVAGN